MTTGDLASIDPAAPQWSKNGTRFADRGADFLAYRMMDTIVREPGCNIL